MRNRSIVAAVAAAALLGGGVIAYNSDTNNPTQEPLVSAPQEAPIRLIEAQPFEVLTPLTHYMRAEQPSYTKGMLLVLSGDPTLLRPRQSLENVLYVGAETAERINTGEQSGYLVVVVPGEVDLASSPIFLGSPALPEQVTAADAQRQLEIALDSGLTGQSVPVADPIQVADGYELHRFASYLVERYAPDEADLISGLRAQRITFQ
ncbi:hypothetical protein [Engelhardtia mirabilis]|uniref:Uncharacterized protein n=1 Tax=Engelhardtia mirabilis TaxID=2528011 RepID=A0A518BRZ1_9BACT|nr:hypothetical protein Pla133_48610 [Planctomycetes bacterium Pla133]QDV04065.1 hypothetical protein Pla86_48590 [Planctomycetes bacterium Pla86]